MATSGGTVTATLTTTFSNKGVAVITAVDSGGNSGNGHREAHLVATVKAWSDHGRPTAGCLDPRNCDQVGRLNLVP